MKVYYVLYRTFLIKIPGGCEPKYGIPGNFEIRAKSKKEAREKGLVKLIKKYGEGYFRITDVFEKKKYPHFLQQ